jgi:hypothetical protein
LKAEFVFLDVAIYLGFIYFNNKGVEGSVFILLIISCFVIKFLVDGGIMHGRGLIIYGSLDYSLFKTGLLIGLGISAEYYFIY